MEIKHKSGTKERLFEMMKIVNKPIITEAVSQSSTETSFDPETNYHTQNTTYNHPNENWGEFREKFTTALSSANQSMPRIISFLHDIELGNKEEELMANYGSINNDEEFKSQASNDFYGWFSDVKGEFGESFDVPKEKDQKYLNKSVDTENRLQVTKKDDGVRYPANKNLKVSDPSLEGLKGDELPFNEALSDDEEEENEIGTEIGEKPIEEPTEIGAEEPNEFGDEVGGEPDIIKEPTDDTPNDNEIDPVDDNPLANVMDVDDDQIDGGVIDGAESDDFDPKNAIQIAIDNLTKLAYHYAELDNTEAGAGIEGGLDIEQGIEDEVSSEEPENALLDPSDHWVDDYVPKNVEEANIEYPEVPDDAEALEGNYEDEQEFNNQNQDVEKKNEIGQEISLRDLAYMPNVKRYPTKPVPLSVNGNDSSYLGKGENENTTRTIKNKQDFEWWKQETLDRFPESTYVIQPNKNKLRWFEDDFIINRLK